MRLGQIVTVARGFLDGPVDHLPQNTGQIVGIDVDHPEFLCVEFDEVKVFVHGCDLEEVDG
jgi:hypothetical protein